MLCIKLLLFTFWNWTKTSTYCSEFCYAADADAGEKSRSFSTSLRNAFLMYGCSAEFLYSVIYGKSSKCSGYSANKKTLHGTTLKSIKREKRRKFAIPLPKKHETHNKTTLTLVRCQDSYPGWHACICVDNLPNCPKCSSFCRPPHRFRPSHSCQRRVCSAKMGYYTVCRWQAAFLWLFMLCTNTLPNHWSNRAECCDSVGQISMCHTRTDDGVKMKFSIIPRRWQINE